MSNKLARSSAVNASNVTPLDLLLTALQLETREIDQAVLPLWKDSLSRYPVETVTQAIRRIIETFDRGDARGIVLGDVTKVIEQIQAESAPKRPSVADEMRDLQKRAAAGEKFYGMKDLAVDFKKIWEGKKL